MRPFRGNPCRHEGGTPFALHFARKRKYPMECLFSGTRRDFLKKSLAGGLTILGAENLQSLSLSAMDLNVKAMKGKVALTAGDDHVNLIFRALNHYRREIQRAIGNRNILIKPNNVAVDVPLCATPVECLEGILEFLKSIGKNQAVITESPGSGKAEEGFENYRYYRLARRYSVKFINLDEQPHEMMYFVSDKDFHPHPARISRMLRDPNFFIISATRLKTHDRVVATLSLKNLVFAAPLKDPDFTWGNNKDLRSDKPICHGGGSKGINFNIFTMAQWLRPNLAVLDGYQGMEGNGPFAGTPVEHRVAVAGLDWLAVDRVGVELMGIDFSNVGYLNYCAQANMGEADLNKIQIAGEPLARHILPYRMNDNFQEQLVWK
jgi:uncharacterized protein (DUF362 family)